MQTKTNQGIAWDSLAKKEYGSEYQMDILLTHNANQIDTLLFSGNIVLSVPNVEKSAIKVPAVWE